MNNYRTSPQMGMNFEEITVDNFAGGGGASTGIEQAMGRPVDVAINHDPQAISMHTVNHPGTKHYCESVWQVDPRDVTQGRPVGLAWFSPDCTHHSKARGGKPTSPRVRGLAWIVLKWAGLVRPRVIMLENVEEFEQWGPLTRSKRPCKRRRGLTFKKFVAQLERLGYTVDRRQLRACDYGAPTIRKRLFLVARCDDQPIVWPEPTHGPGLKPYCTAADIIDWSIPCPSIFDRKKPLAENTLRRIAKGIQRFVIDNPKPFIVTNTSCNPPQSTSSPTKTITTGNHHYLVTPYLTEHANSTHQRVFPADDPLRTQCASVKGGHFALVAPYLVPRYGERKDQSPRCNSAEEPMATIVPDGNHGHLVAAYLAKHFGGVTGTEADNPLPTTTTRGTQTQLVTTMLAGVGGRAGQSRPRNANEPTATVTAKADTALVTSHLLKLRGTCQDGQPVTEPAPTVTAGGNHIGEVRAFLLKYYGTNIGHAVDEPLQTITSKHRFGLVTVRGEQYQIVDIGMRMLTPAELYRAQGFPPDYIIDRDAQGKPITKTQQVAKCGNSVCPPVAEALVRANLVDAVEQEGEVAA